MHVSLSEECSISNKESRDEDHEVDSLCEDSEIPDSSYSVINDSNSSYIAVPEILIS